MSNWLRRLKPWQRLQLISWLIWIAGGVVLVLGLRFGWLEDLGGLPLVGVFLVLAIWVLAMQLLNRASTWGSSRRIHIFAGGSDRAAGLTMVTAAW